MSRYIVKHKKMKIDTFKINNNDNHEKDDLE